MLSWITVRVRSPIYFFCCEHLSPVKIKMIEVLSENQLSRLKDHTYRSECVSFLEPMMQPFWRWLVNQIPLWWAPNAITLTGLVINVATACILIFYSPDARQAVSFICVNYI